MKAVLCASLTILLTTIAYAGLPGDAAAGKRLHDASCTGCHDSSVYTRKDRTIRTLDGLKHQLEGCAHATKQNFTAVQSQDIIKYLNDQFYHFR
jgi:cytochrome c553